MLLHYLPGLESLLIIPNLMRIKRTKVKLSFIRIDVLRNWTGNY
jgi:hypothetical protein